MAFPSIRSQLKTSTPSTETQHTFVYPADIEAADTLLCIVTSDGDNVFDWAGATSPTSGGWKKIYEVSSSDNQVCLSVGVAKADGDEADGDLVIDCAENEKAVCRFLKRTR